jgi:hypothetical protein
LLRRPELQRQRRPSGRSDRLRRLDCRARSTDDQPIADVLHARHGAYETQRFRMLSAIGNEPRQISDAGMEGNVDLEISEMPTLSQPRRDGVGDTLVGITCIEAHAGERQRPGFVPGPWGGGGILARAAAAQGSAKAHSQDGGG